MTLFLRPIVASLLLLFAFVLNAKTFVVSVGIGRYADSRVSTLTKTEADARSVTEFYRKGGGEVVTLLGSEATRSNILETLSSQFRKAGPDDKILLFFSGHGYPGGFCPYDMRDLSGGVSYTDVVSIMKKSKASVRLVFADACHSGALRSSDKSSSGSSEETKTSDVMFFLSSRGSVVSFESPRLPNGYFTHSLLRGLKGGADEDRDRTITASELFRFVSAEVRRQTSDRQHPVMWGRFDDRLPLVRYAPRR